jgi:hypothetical protein
MTIGILKLKLRIPNSNSLKEKRMVLRSLKDRLKKFNISIAEINDQDKWQIVQLVATAVGVDKRIVNSTLSEVVNFIEKSALVELVDFAMEMV